MTWQTLSSFLILFISIGTSFIWTLNTDHINANAIIGALVGAFFGVLWGGLNFLLTNLLLKKTKESPLTIALYLMLPVVLIVLSIPFSIKVIHRIFFWF